MLMGVGCVCTNCHNVYTIKKMGFIQAYSALIEPVMKRFYEIATAQNGAVLLDGKALHSPAKHPVVFPNSVLAEACAKEWNAQGEIVDKASLPFTSLASLALDIVPAQRDAMIDELVEYGETDLLFYRDEPDSALGEQQHREWQPWLNNAQVEWGTRYLTGVGISPVAQPEENRMAHRHALQALGDWELALMAFVVKPTTSLILSWFFLKHRLNAQELFHLSRLEEAHNTAQWGEDEEAAKRASALQADLNAAEEFIRLLFA